MDQVTTVRTMTLDGGVACFDFINSGFDMERDLITERLHSYEDLLVLTERLKLLNISQLQYLQSLAKHKAQDSKLALKETLKIRMLMYEFFSGLTELPLINHGQRLIRKINKLFAEALKYRVLQAEGGIINFTFELTAAGLMAPAWLFILSAYDLLQNDQLKFAKRCQRCSWLFLDQTKNHRKKWCSMEACGNRVKTKKYYNNKKKAQ